MSSGLEIGETLQRLCDEFTVRQVPKLPPERELSERLGVSRGTVRRYLDELESKGVVRRVRGRAGGAYLTAVNPQRVGPETTVSIGQARQIVRDLNHAQGLPGLLSQQGFSSGTRVLSANTGTESTTASEFLTGKSDGLTVSLLRLRYADGDSLVLERFYVSAERFPTLLGQRLDQSMYGLLESEYGILIGNVEETIEVAAAPFNVAQALSIAEGDPLLKVTRRSWDQSERPVEYSIDLFRADRTRLTVNSEGSAIRKRGAVRQEGPFTRS